MPELPDVEYFKTYIDATSLHQAIDSVAVHRDDILGKVSARSLRQRLLGRSLESTERHGKYLFARLSGDGWLVLHFGMTGELNYSSDGDVPSHTRLCLHFDNGRRLAYICQRMLGTVDWTADPRNYIEGKQLGIDAASDELDLPRFREILSGKRGSVKGALMDQSTIAGLGNVYVDEILLRAGVHPKASVPGLRRDAVERLFRAMRAVPHRGDRRGGGSQPNARPLLAASSRDRPPRLPEMRRKTRGDRGDGAQVVCLSPLPTAVATAGFAGLPAVTTRIR